MLDRSSLSKNAQKSLPDVAIERVGQTKTLSGALDWVGMTRIEVPIWTLNQQGEKYRSAALVDAFVSLNDPEARGIHMSRLYAELQSSLTKNILNFTLLEKILQAFLESHKSLSLAARIKVHHSALLERPALKSANSGWRTYPISMSAKLGQNEKAKFYLETQIIYSSTCPASAALSRHLIQENFKESFHQQNLQFKNIYDWLGTTAGINATPHAQRSRARVKVELAPGKNLSVETLIDLLEEALQTSVQTYVKREDEQEFARRNAQNLMFCEDAARRIKNVLEKNLSIAAYVAEMHHEESLHPHDATSRISKNLSF